MIAAILLMSVKIVFGQSVRYEKVVTYDTKVTWDTPSEFESKLYIGKTESCFIYRGPQKNLESISKDPSIKSKIYFGSKYPLFYLKRYDKNYLQFLGQIILNGTRYYIVNDTIPTIKWKLSNKTKILDGYVCHKAIGVFRGRKYNVWFSSQIPLSLGPWKLGGLPGLIFEAIDSTGNVSFRLVSIKNKKGKLSLGVPNLKKITWSEYKKLFQKSWKRLAAFFRSSQNENVQVHVSKPSALEQSIFKK